MKFPGNPYQEFIYTRTYSRYIEPLKRREEWPETVRRYETFMTNQLVKHLEKQDVQFIDGNMLIEFNEAVKRIYSMQVMPSMRTLWTAGEALERENIAGYNCAYVPVDKPKVFAEILYILMCGTGVGFSTERQYINNLPCVPELRCGAADPTIVFEDSKLGWATGFLRYIEGLYKGFILEYDTSKIRQKGARLKTFGGRASGPEPLIDLLKFTTQIFKAAKGRRLNSIEVYDIICKTAEVVVVGGVRRSATINLSNFSDQRMKHAKSGQFWVENPQRFLSNNSVAYTEKPDMVSFMDEWFSLVSGGNGERGLVNREGLIKSQEAIGRKPSDFGVNPCGEIILRPRQFCNLSEVVVRPADSLETLKEKVKYATVLGAVQATLTDFQFLDPEWKANCEEERLLGVSLTGVADHGVLNNGSPLCISWLTALRKVAEVTSQRWARYLHMNIPAAVTCVKPSGTVSQLTDTASGLHPRYAQLYQRRVQVTKTDPLGNLLIAQGVPYEDINDSTYAFKFCMSSPACSVYRNDRTALEQLEYWLVYKQHWCHHNPSVTIYVDNHEWLEVGAWLYKNWEHVGGLSFFPKLGSSMPNAPYEDLDEPFVNPPIDFTQLSLFEQQDQTQGAKEFACVGGQCEL